ncbi:MAG TPA: murein biosynthesis integral membrane protein MurJ [Candidatus Bathyarchaeia archaeon]|nr:murein biosynthesis integral membrane protein MurJ [Candidatus Bathyarchaeia archaeon]
MVEHFFKNNSRILTRPQKSIISAATIIMVMVAASRFLGLLRNRILAYYFSAELLSVYFAAFRLPEIVFEVLVFGTLASAFIPIFTTYLTSDKKEAWRVASISINIAFLIFLFFAVLIFFLAKPLYQVIVPGFSPAQLAKTIVLARILILAQGFFLLSYFSTAILESLKRFLVPAIAPLFYNLGIILGTVFLTGKLDILAPAVGAVIGALMHFLVQLPLVFHLGFRPQWQLNFRHPGVKKIAGLAFPRMAELSFMQIGKSLELFLATIIGPAAYTYLTFANALQLLPVSLFGISIAKASLPNLSYQTKQPQEFKTTFVSSFNQILYLTFPCAVFLAVLRIPAVRLFFGAPRFDWPATIQTSFALSAFCLGIVPQSLVLLLNRTFYALHDTLTPMVVSILSLLLNAFLGLVLVLVYKFPVWGLAFSSSLASIFQMAVLLFFIHKKRISFSKKEFLLPFLKIASASFLSGGIMYIVLRILDRSAWDKSLSFLGKFGLVLPISLNFFVLDTRYTLNLIVVTFMVGILGMVVYLLLSWLLKIKEFYVLLKLFSVIEKFGLFPPRFLKKRESITIDGSSRIE